MRKEIKIQIWDFSKRGGHYIVGEVVTTLQQLIMISREKKPQLKLQDTKGKKSKGKILIKKLLRTQGPSIIRKIFQGWKINLMIGIDCTGINADSQDLDDRFTFLDEFSKKIMKKMSLFLLSDSIQYFGINGKCSNDHFHSNYTMDIFPISGQVSKNGFKSKQIGGSYFEKVMNNFYQNTEGGEFLENLSSFFRYGIDYSDECLKFNDDKVFSIIPIFLSTIPEDIDKCIDELVDLQTRPTIFWILYFGKKDRQKMTSLDCRKGYLIGDKRKVGTRPKILVECVSLKSKPEQVVHSFITNTQHLFAFYRKPKTSY